MRPHSGRWRQTRLFDVTGAENMEDLLARGEKIVRDDAPMASPPQSLGAHDA